MFTIDKQTVLGTLKATGSQDPGRALQREDSISANV